MKTKNKKYASPLSERSEQLTQRSGSISEFIKRLTAMLRIVLPSIKKSEPDFLIDHHSHILPGVDDGIATFEESLEILIQMHRKGVQSIHLTPHCYHPLYPNTLATLLPVFKHYIEQLGNTPGITVAAQTATTATLNIQRSISASDFAKAPSDPTGPSGSKSPSDLVKGPSVVKRPSDSKSLSDLVKGPSAVKRPSDSKPLSDLVKGPSVVKRPSDSKSLSDLVKAPSDVKRPSDSKSPSDLVKGPSDPTGPSDQLTLILSGELRLSQSLLSAINAEEELPTFLGNHLLLENSLTESSPLFHDIQFALQARGYQLVLAHPERYGYWHHDFSNYRKLADNGWKFQINRSSLSGRYGSAVKNIATKLHKNGIVHYWGSDLHGRRHLEYI